MIEHTIGYQVWIIDLMVRAQLVFGSLCMISFIFLICCIGSAQDKYFIRFCGFVFIVFALFAFIIPSERAMYLMMSDGIIKEVQERKIPEKALQILDKKLDEYLKKEYK